MQVVGNRVMIAPDVPEKQTSGGLWLPEQSQEESQTGVIVAVGSGEYHEKTGRWQPIRDLDVGDRVLYSKYGGTVIEINEDEMLLVSPKDIFAIIN